MYLSPTADISNCAAPSCEPRLCNLFQVLAFNAVNVSLIFSGAMLAGAGFGWAILLGSFGGAMVTIGVLLTAVLYVSVRAEQVSSDPIPRMENAAARRAALISQWDEDLAADRGAVAAATPMAS